MAPAGLELREEAGTVELTEPTSTQRFPVETEIEALFRVAPAIVLLSALR
jgi:hypothetical protein